MLYTPGSEKMKNHISPQPEIAGMFSKALDMIFFDNEATFQAGCTFARKKNEKFLPDNVGKYLLEELGDFSRVEK